MRVFLAIELPEKSRRHLDRLCQHLRRPHDLAQSVSWVKRENWHITLKFLGEVEDACIPEITTALAAVQVHPMNLFADRMQYFPKRGPVRVVSVGIGGDAGLLNHLHKHIEDALQPLGFPREDRPYTAHITFGRSRHGARRDDWMTLRAMKLETDFPGPSFTADQFVLVQSKLRPEGSEYTVAARFPPR